MEGKRLNNELTTDHGLDKQEALKQLQSGEQSTAQLNNRVAKILDDILQTAKNGYDIDLAEVEEQIEELVPDKSAIDSLILKSHIPELAEELLDENHGQEMVKKANDNQFDEGEHRQLLMEKINAHPYLKERHANFKKKIVDYLHQHVVRKNVLYYGGMEKLGTGVKGKLDVQGRVVYNVKFFYNFAKESCHKHNVSLDYFDKNSVDDLMVDLNQMKSSKSFIRILEKVSGGNREVIKEIKSEMAKVKSHEVTHRLVRLVGQEHGFVDLSQADIEGRNTASEYQQFRDNKDEYHQSVIKLLEEDELSVANLTAEIVANKDIAEIEAKRSAQLVIDELMAEIIENNLESVIKDWSPSHNPEVENNLKAFMLDFFSGVFDKALTDKLEKVNQKEQTNRQLEDLGLDEKFNYLKEIIRQLDTKELMNLENRLGDFEGEERLATVADLGTPFVDLLITDIRNPGAIVNLWQFKESLKKAVSLAVGEKITEFKVINTAEIVMLVNKLNINKSAGASNLTEDELKKCLVEIRVAEAKELDELVEVVANFEGEACVDNYNVSNFKDDIEYAKRGVGCPSILFGTKVDNLVSDKENEIKTEIRSKQKLEDIGVVLRENASYFENVGDFTDIVDRAKKAKDSREYDSIINEFNRIQRYEVKFKDKVKNLIDKEKADIQTEINNIKIKKVKTDVHGNQKEEKRLVEEMLKEVKEILVKNPSYFENVDNFEHIINNAKKANNGNVYKNILESLDLMISPYNISLVSKVRKILDIEHQERIEDQEKGFSNCEDLASLKKFVCDSKNNRYFNDITDTEFNSVVLNIKQGEDWESMVNYHLWSKEQKDILKEMLKKEFKNKITKSKDLNELQAVLTEYIFVKNTENGLFKDRIDNGEYFLLTDLEISGNNILKDGNEKNDLEDVLCKINELSPANALWDKVNTKNGEFEYLTNFSDLKQVQKIIKKLDEDVLQMNDFKGVNGDSEFNNSKKELLMTEFLDRICKYVEFVQDDKQVFNDFLSGELDEDKLDTFINVAQDLDRVVDNWNRKGLEIQARIDELSIKVDDGTINIVEQKELDKKKKELVALSSEVLDFDKDIRKDDIEMFGLDTFEKRKIFYTHRSKIMQALDAIDKEHKEMLKESEKKIKNIIKARAEIKKNNELLANIATLGVDVINKDSEKKEFIRQIFNISGDFDLTAIRNNSGQIKINYQDSSGVNFFKSLFPDARLRYWADLQKEQEKIKNGLIFKKDQMKKEKAREIFDDNFYTKYREYSKLGMVWKAIKKFSKWDEDKEKNAGTILWDSIKFWAKFSVSGPGGLKKVWDTVNSTFAEHAESNRIEMAKWGSDILTAGMDDPGYKGFIRNFMGITAKQGMKFDMERDKEIKEEISNKYPQWGESMQAFNNSGQVRAGILELKKIKNDYDQTSNTTRRMLLEKVFTYIDGGVPPSAVYEFKELISEYFYKSQNDVVYLEKVGLTEDFIKSNVSQLGGKNSFFSDIGFNDYGEVIKLNPSADPADYKEYEYLKLNSKTTNPEFLEKFYAKLIGEMVKFVNSDEFSGKETAKRIFRKETHTGKVEEMEKVIVYDLSELNENYMEEINKKVLPSGKFSITELPVILDGDKDWSFKNTWLKPVRTAIRENDDNDYFENWIRVAKNRSKYISNGERDNMIK